MNIVMQRDTFIIACRLMFNGSIILHNDTISWRKAGFYSNGKDQSSEVPPYSEA